MDKLAELRNIVKVLEDRPTKQEVADAIRTVLDVVKNLKLKDFLSGELKTAEGQMQTRVLEQALSEVQKARDLLRKEMGDSNTKSSSELKRELNNFSKALREGIEEVKSLIPSKSVFDRLNERIDLLRDMRSEDRTKFNEEIEKIKEELKKIEGIARTKVVGGTRRIYQPYRDDLSADCDGNNKTFYLTRAPLDEGTIMVYGTDFPVVLRPTIDFTIANKTLTLTASVPAPSEGATLLVTYFS